MEELEIKLMDLATLGRGIFIFEILGAHRAKNRSGGLADYSFP